jgi:hypothetical protein
MLPPLTGLAAAAAMLAFASASIAASAFAQQPTSLIPDASTPRSPSGHPDLQGAVWATNFFPVFETSPLSAKLTVSEEEAKKIVSTMQAGVQNIPDFKIDPEAEDIIMHSDGLPIVRGERRTRLIVLPADGKLPLTPEAKKLIAADKDSDIGDNGGKDNHEQRPSSERCIVLSGAPPSHAIISYNRMQFIETPGHVVIHSENGDEARIIPFTATHKPPGPASWFGDAIARWDGDTLVVETIRQRSAPVRGLFSKFVVARTATVIERFTRVSKDELVYQFTVIDPASYSAPWLAEYSFFDAPTGMFPSACHEHNYSLPNILLGQRVADARVKKK